MNCPEHWTHIISTDVRVKSHCKEFPVNKGTCTRLSMSGSSIFAVLVTHLAFWSGLSAADFPLFSGHLCPPLSSKAKPCRSALAHYLFVKMQPCQSLAMHILLCVFMIISATHTLCPPQKNYCPAIYIENLLTSILLVDRPLKEKVVFYSFSFSPVQLKKSMSVWVYCTLDTILAICDTASKEKKKSLLL